MKVTIYENILNKERYHCIDVRDIQVIDGVEFLKVFKDKFDRSVLIRKDTLKKISAKTISGYDV